MQATSKRGLWVTRNAVSFGWDLKKACHAAGLTRKGPRSSSLCKDGRDLLKTLKDVSSRCPQKSRRSEVRFALWYASVSRAGDGKSDKILL